MMVEDVSESLQNTFDPIFFEDVSHSEEAKFEDQEGAHVFVLVHGLLGKSEDMRLIKDSIHFVCSNAVIMSSRANEENTDRDIFVMGEALAEELEQYLKEWCPGSKLGKLTFVCHSLGGLIARAALPHLRKYQDKMRGFVTLATPHLGYMYSKSVMVTAGLKIMKWWKRSTSLSQLRYEDHADPKKTAVYKL